jgi:branched-chain amino acid transport system ATP-binding protein
LLDVRDLHTYYGDSYVLQGVSLQLEEGQVVVVLGRNGAGKTTLVRSIIGFMHPRMGQIMFEGRAVTGLPAHRIAQLGIGIVPQGRRVFGPLSVRENLEIAAHPNGPRSRSGGRWNLNTVLERFPRLGERLSQRAGKLSGGEQQMLACGRALMGNPRLLLMDEPSEGLAPLMVKELGTVIRDMKAQGLSILLVEQKLGFALEHADYVYVLSTGRIVYEGNPLEFRQNEGVQAKYLGV